MGTPQALEVRLHACTGKEASNLRLPVGAHVGPDNGRPELVRLAHHCIVRNDDPFAVEPHAIVAVLCIPIDVVDLKPSAKEQQSPLPLASRSNQDFSGELA